MLLSTSEADAAAGTVIVDDKQQAKKKNIKGSDQKQQQTKRQRRAAKNDKHAWPQHPKIQNPTQRETAYVRAAGLLLQPQQLQSQSQPPNNGESVASSSLEQNNFARQLGSADARTRHKTVLQLRQYLKARCSNDIISNDNNSNTGISELELLKLWKCLWYTLYMADRVPVQAELCQHMASLIWSVAGSAEQDEYAAAAYMELDRDHDFDCDEFDDHDNDSDDDDGSSDVVGDDEDEVIMEEIENTLTTPATSDDGDEEESTDESSDVDLEEKQIALLQEEDMDGDEGEADADEGDAASDDDEASIDDANVGHCRGAHLAALFVRTFFRTVVREWGTMDKYRIDKFYTCIRDMMAVVYEYMAKRHWSTGIIRLFNDAIYDEVLSQTPNGVRYHVIDVCLEELCKAAEKAALPLTEATLVDVLEPYFALAQTGCGGDDTVHARVVENVLEKFLTRYSVYSEAFVGANGNTNNNRTAQKKGHDDNDKNDSSRLPAKVPVLDQVHVGTISQFIFEVASDEGVLKDAYRKNLYNVHKKYARRIREIGEEQDVELNDIHVHDEDCNHENLDDDDEMEEHDHGEDIFNEEDEQLDEDIEKFEKEEADSESVEEEEPTKKVTKSAKVITKKEAPDAATQEVTTEPSTKRQKKKKKKKNKAEKINELPAEEEITITYADQRAAKKALEQKDESSVKDAAAASNTRKRKSEAAQRKEDAADAKKRVKFGDINRARSWKASMQGLRELETPILNVTPERGILLNKGKKVVMKNTRNMNKNKNSGRK